MEKHMQFLNMYIVATKSNDINRNNLDFYWYGVWNVVLSYCFESRFLVVPQYVISYELVNRDDNKIWKSVKPDFVVTVKVRFTEPRFTRSYQPKSYYQVPRTQDTCIRSVWFGTFTFTHSSFLVLLHPVPILLCFVSVSLRPLRPYMPTSCFIYSSLHFLCNPSSYLWSSIPVSFSYISSIHRCMYSPF